MSAESTPDIHTTAGRAEVLRSRRSEAAGKRQAAVDKQHAKQMTAMERIEAFLDPDHFKPLTALPGTVRTTLVWKKPGLMVTA